MLNFSAPLSDSSRKEPLKHERSASFPWRFPLPETGTPVPTYYGCNVFDQRAMRNYVSESVVDSLSELDEGKSLSDDTADSIAKGLLSWATERGATHFCHWFQPLTDVFAGKHDTFIKMDKGHPINRFRGKDLVKSEADGSSVPSGGLRETHTARGYTVWDPK
eukprot:TRINITY_DN3456_c0_g2_i2.p1 TRINITY_DN3456_c0_g2~~TRINITY_DN3456_c0_g2_i2.p1  ORF type:complete len:173 (-),score=5.22 TRINITY_DN3456_c0_g2_i2:71-559(-)